MSLISIIPTSTGRNIPKIPPKTKLPKSEYKQYPQIAPAGDVKNATVKQCRKIRETESSIVFFGKWAEEADSPKKRKKWKKKTRRKVRKNKRGSCALLRLQFDAFELGGKNV